MNRVNLEKAGFSLVPGVMSPDGDVLVKEFPRFGTAYALEGELFPIRF
jgi:hypothetical protein